MIRFVAILALASCYLDRIPVTEAVARASTYRIAVQARSGFVVHGDAWAIDEHHLVTAGALCAGAENIALLVDYGVIPVLVHVDTSRLCLLDAPASLKLGPPLVLARTWHPSSTHLVAVGSPMWSQWGVVGVVLELDAAGHATQAAGRAELERFARAHHVRFDVAPPASDVDQDISCQQGAKARGWCSTFEPGSVAYPGDGTP